LEHAAQLHSKGRTRPESLIAKLLDGHPPPTLFLGFALTLVPFAFLMAGLWKKQLTEWISPALPWSLFGAGVLGVGIMMGAYWAYETLNFGGYWNWDPWKTHHSFLGSYGLAESTP